MSTKQFIIGLLIVASVTWMALAPLVAMIPQGH